MITMLPCRGCFFRFPTAITWLLQRYVCLVVLCKQFLHYCRDGLAVSLASHFL